MSLDVFFYPFFAFFSSPFLFFIISTLIPTIVLYLIVKFLFGGFLDL